MKRRIVVLTVAAVMAAMMVGASSLPGVAQPQGGEGCEGLANAVLQQAEHGGSSNNEGLTALAREFGEQGCQPSAAVCAAFASTITITPELLVSCNGSTTH